MNTTHRAPQDKVCGYEYTVRRGDSFYLIANRLGVPLRDLLEANSDVNPARLMVGDVLCIPMEEDDAPTLPQAPAPETPTPPQTPQEPAIPPESEPETSPDDDLDAPAAIPEDSTAIDPDMAVCPEADRYTVAAGETVADIQLRANVNRYTLEQANPAADLERLSAGQTLCVPKENAACPIPRTYTLQSEDTLESTALRLNTSLAALLRANPCLAPADFSAGRCIWIP